MDNQLHNFVELVRNIYKTDKPILLHEPRFHGNEKKYLNDTIDSTFVSSVGEYVNRFEKDFARITQTKFAVATVNGTAALHIALKVCEVTPNSQVITQPLTFVATCNAISYCGAEPLFIDVDEETMGLSPSSLRKFLKENSIQKNGKCINKKTDQVISACLPMHTFGHPVKISEIAEICQEYNIPLIEDAAEALGSKYKNRSVGTFGKISAFSFNGNKIITTGGGGMIVTDDENLARRCKHLTTTAKIPHPWEFFHDEIGYNYRLPNLNAALGCAQLEQLSVFLSKKRKLANFYRENLTDFISEPAQATSNYWLNAIKVKDKKTQIQFLEKSNQLGIMTRPIWQLMHHLPAFKNCQRQELKVAENLAETVINIPSSVPLDYEI